MEKAPATERCRQVVTILRFRMVRPRTLDWMSFTGVVLVWVTLVAVRAPFICLMLGAVGALVAVAGGLGLHDHVTDPRAATWGCRSA